MNLAAATVNSGVGNVSKKFIENRKNGEISSSSNSPLKDSPRSVSDLKFTVSPRGQDSDSDILDLDGYDLTDDDESWLYSGPAGKVTSTDITAWLKKDADNLDPKTRRALVVKLEAFLRRKNSAGTISNDSCDSDRRPNALKETSVLSNESKTRAGNEPNLVSNKNVPFLNLDQNELNSNTSRISDDPRKDILLNKHSDLNPDMKDIQLLASMQEQDLRQCLQQLNTRRRMTPEHQDRLGTSPKSFFSSPTIRSPSSFSAGTSPKLPSDFSATYIKPSDLSATYVKPTVYSTPKSFPQKMAVSRKISTPGDFKKLQKISTLPAEKHIGLRKSLPNLAASRSGEFCLPSSNHDSNSEKGSCGDIPNGLSPSQSTQRMANGIRSSNSRLPTPSRMLNQPRNSVTLSKSSIPVPRSRAKSPAPKMSLQTRLVDRYNWQDGCI